MRRCYAALAALGLFAGAAAAADPRLPTLFIVADSKAKGATPIVLSPVPRNIWKDGNVARASNDYGKWAAESAKAGGAFFLDLNELVAKRYEEVGPETVKTQYFGEDHTHTTPAG